MLPLSFHKSFIPERRLIARLLDYAVLGKEGSLKEISHETGIPMGESTGKTQAVVDYATAMGLISVEAGETRGRKRPILTAFGRAVYREDRYLSEQLSQWLAHMSMCRSDIGARAWYEVFARGYRSLGSSFGKKNLEDHLATVFGPGPNRTGPILSVYTDDAALGRTGALTVLDEAISRNKAPLLSAYWLPYSVYVLALMDAVFPGESQVTVADFNARTFLFDICLWGAADLEYALSHIERKGLISVDRQMRPWILERCAVTDEAWLRLFEDVT